MKGQGEELRPLVGCQLISRVKRYKLNSGRAAGRQAGERKRAEWKQVQGQDERQTMMGNCGESWKVDKPRDSGFKSDRDRQAGRQMAREREWWANSQRSRQTARERKQLPASQGGAGRQAGIITEASR